VVKTATGGGGSGNEMMQLLLEQMGDDVQIMPQVIEAIAQHLDGKIMQLLLEQKGVDVQITSQVVEAAARNDESNKEVMHPLLEQRGA
jgi:hypothetical protein